MPDYVLGPGRDSALLLCLEGCKEQDLIPQDSLWLKDSSIQADKTGDIVGYLMFCVQLRGVWMASPYPGRFQVPALVSLPVFSLQVAQNKGVSGSV